MAEYNGWTNYETWNVALWIGNDKGLYETAKGFKHQREPYTAFVTSMRELADDYGPGENTISIETPDGVAWNDSGLNISELDNMITEL